MSKTIDSIKVINNLVVDGTSQSVTTNTGALIVAGGVGVVKNVNIGENLDVLLTSTLGGVVSVTDITESNDTITGALVVSGGIGIAKKLNVGGVVSLTDITQSSSDSTGALVVTGGVGVGKSVTIGDELNVDRILATKYTDTQKQFITPVQSIGIVFGICEISGNGLWAAVTARSVGSSHMYSRKNINEPFIFNSYLVLAQDISFSSDGKYVALYISNFLYIYSRNTETDIWTLNFLQQLNSWKHTKMSSDGTYVFGINSGNQVIRLRRTPGTNTWVLIPGSMSTISSAANIYGASEYVDSSIGGGRVIGHSREGFTVFRKTGDTEWVIEQANINGGDGPSFGLSINDDGDFILATTNLTRIYKRTGTIWNVVFVLPIISNRGRISKDGSTVRSGNFIYKRVTDDYWKLITTFDNTITGGGISDTRVAFGFNYDGSTFIIGDSVVSGAYVYDITNEVSFDQTINTKTINFNDTLKITSAYDAVDHLLTMPPFNQSGCLINDGVGNTTWGSSYNQSLNTGDAVQFDRVGISPNIGQILTPAQLQLSMRLINESYTGDCVQIRRGTTFITDYLLDTELGDSASLTAGATYNSTGGASSRGQFTATLAVSDTFTVDGVTLSSANNGTRILLIGQNIPSENGIWTTTISGTSLTLDRSTDFDGDGEVNLNDSFKISLGTTYGNTGQLLTTTDDPIILGGATGSDLTFSTIELTKDIGFTSGVINISELSTLLGSDDGYVSIWYDQSGNSNDFVQASEANQPRILLTGGINWLPTVSFDGVDDYLDAGDVLDISTSTGWYVNLVADTNVTGGAIISKSTDSLANRWGLSFNSGNFDVIYEDTVDSTVSTAQASGDPQIISLSIDRAAGTKTINSYINNTIINTNIPITNDNTYDFNSATSVLLGAIDNVGLTYATGFISEVVIHNFAPTTSERVGLEQDQSSFYGITIIPIPKVNLKISPNITVDYDLVLPATQGANAEVLLNDGAGNLAWGVPTDVPQLPSMTSAIDQVQLKNYINSIKQTNSESYIRKYTHGITAVNFAYTQGVYDPINDYIWLVPYGQGPELNWHYINCDTGEVVPYLHGVTAVLYAYHSAVFHPILKRIYLIPYSQGPQTDYHYIDLLTKTVVAYTHAGITMVSNAYIGGCYSPNEDRIWIAPHSQGNQSLWHYIDSAGAFQSYTRPVGTMAAASAYSGASYSPTQNFIYFIPFVQSSISNYNYVDCNTSTVVAYTPAFINSTGSYWGGTYSPIQNRIYLSNWIINQTWAYIDCNDGIIKSQSIAPATMVDGYSGGTYVPTLDRIYFSPKYNETIQGNWIYLNCSTNTFVEYLTDNTFTADDFRNMTYDPVKNRTYIIPFRNGNDPDWYYLSHTSASICDKSLMAGYLFNNL
jgi:hypothetical protein